MSLPPASADTDPAAEAVMLDIYREMPAWRKARLVEDANQAARQLAMAGLRARHPEETLDRLRRRLLGLSLGEELAAEVYGPLDDSP
jgi:hypothetical protein